MLFFGLLFIAVALTVVMFATRQAMLGFACVIFWAILGAEAYTLSTVPWGDTYYYMFFASLFGMTTFCALAAFGMRERRDTIADKELEKGEGDYIDESGGEPNLLGEEKETKPSKRTRALRKRAEGRRTKL